MILKMSILIIFWAQMQSRFIKQILTILYSNIFMIVLILYRIF